MALLIPAIKGKLGTTIYYEATMKVRDLVQAVRPPREMDGWTSFSIEERMQRNADMPRIKKQLAPYLVRNADRFFGSIIVLVYGGPISFESLTDLAKNVPVAYKQVSQQIGFLTIDRGSLIVLDGQHRLIALRMAQQGDIQGPFSSTVGDDDVCVIFIEHEEDIKTRRIFNTVNRYAKSTTRSDNIITSEDDGYAIVARRILAEGNPLATRKSGGEPEDVVEWKNNTLGVRSTRLTTIGVVYETVRLILAHHDIPKLDPQDRPDDDQLDEYTQYVSDLWTSLVERIGAFKTALGDLKKIPAMREDTSQTSLLFKPAAQVALVDGVLRAVKLGKMSLDEVIDRINQVPDWSMTSDCWRDIITKSGGTIDASTDARDRMAHLVTYFLVADKLSDAVKYDVWKRYITARGNREDLPIPVAGPAFTAEDAKKYEDTALSKAA
ncbi:DNA sulfur modification protein DndB [Methylobacterium sp. 174MFSha1.1]|uniref:DNA sulfur modification protein DndB n=1 Tax=Methylobacterium sp. 174MFSha1.1 TaxID=1502749 RepID=UPI0008EB210E|nr:DNA sulfur modification protein DndB [Methylobacterium sp. 174MFSha1.1]SFU78099.1 DNA sulfur modification protein DndB [Methylobacterium sp. 174MFSha1.1]